MQSQLAIDLNTYLAEMAIANGSKLTFSMWRSMAIALSMDRVKSIAERTLWDTLDPCPEFVKPH